MDDRIAPMSLFFAVTVFFLLYAPAQGAALHRIRTLQRVIAPKTHSSRVQHILQKNFSTDVPKNSRGLTNGDWLKLGGVFIVTYGAYQYIQDTRKAKFEEERYTQSRIRELKDRLTYTK